MGKNKDKKKKGKGMEKTVAKTEKKAQKRLDKELKEIGEVLKKIRIHADNTQFARMLLVFLFEIYRRILKN